MKRQYVAIDLLRRRSVIVREDDAGEELGVVRIDNDPVALANAFGGGDEPFACVVKLFDGGSYGVAYLAKGLHQAVR